MGYKAIDTNESYQIDENGKVIDSILRSVEPETDEDGPFINTNNGKVYIAEKLEELHGEGAANAYMKRFEAEQDAIKANRELSDSEVTEGGDVVETEKEVDTDTEGEEGSPVEADSEDENSADTVETVTEEEEVEELSAAEKVSLVAEYFKANNDATYQQVKDALAEDGFKVNDQHVSKGKEKAGLKG